MTRNEYLSALRGQLHDLPREEQDAALRYYEEYFAEAESEEEAARQLGAPEETAQKILSENAKKAAKEARKQKYPPMFWVGVGLLGVFASPLLLAAAAVALALVLAAAAVVLSAVCAVLAPAVTLTVTFIGLFFLLWYLAVGAAGVFLPGALVLAGLGMLCGALGILCGIFTGYLAYWIYLLFKWIVTSIFRRKGGKGA